MSKRVVLITGGTAGIGLEAVRKLAEYGATVIFTGRDKAKGEAVEAKLKKETNNLQLFFMQADFNSAQAVNDFAEAFKRRFKKLHILIHNAGTIQKERRTTVDGFEYTMFVNYFAPFLLTNALLNMMRRSAPARIINVSDASHQVVQLNINDLQNEKKYNGRDVYNQSKLALIYFTYELAKRVETAGITVNALHPGVVKTDFYKEYRKNPLNKIIENVKSVRPEFGVMTHLYLAASSDVEGETGKYYVSNMEKKSARVSYDEQMQAQLWDVTTSLLHEHLTVK